MYSAPQIPPSMYALLGWAGGAASTVAGSWIASKIHVYHAHRDAHRDELKERVLIPLRDCLDNDYEPRAKFAKAIVSLNWKQTAFRAAARSTEPQTDEGVVLEAENPWPAFKATVDAALYQDARAIHFAQVMKDAEEFVSAWEVFAENVRTWIREISQGFIHSTGLPPFTREPGENPYAMHDHLAMFVYKRVCHLETGSLSRTSTGSSFQSLMNGQVNVATAFGPGIEAVIQAVDTSIAAQESKGEFFINRAKGLAVQLDVLKGKVQLAIANTRLHGRCGLVRFR